MSNFFLNLILSNQMWFVRHRRCQLSGPLCAMLVTNPSNNLCLFSIVCFNSNNTKQLLLCRVIYDMVDSQTYTLLVLTTSCNRSILYCFIDFKSEKSSLFTFVAAHPIVRLQHLHCILLFHISRDLFSSLQLPPHFQG